MPLTWGGVKRLMRLRAVVEQFGVIVEESEDSRERRDPRRGLGRVLEDLIDEVHAALRDGDVGLADEFERIVIDTAGPPLPLSARAAILTGWLEGAVEAETLEVRIRAGDSEPRSRKLTSGSLVAG